MFCLGLSAWKAPLHPSFCCRKWAGLPQIAIKPCSGNGTPADALPPIECTAAVLDISLNLFVSWKLNLRRFLTFHTGIPDTMLYICMQCPAALRSTAHPCADLRICIMPPYKAASLCIGVLSMLWLPSMFMRFFAVFRPQQQTGGADLLCITPAALRNRQPVFFAVHAPTTEHGIDKARCPATQKARFPQYMPQQLSME